MIKINLIVAVLWLVLAYVIGGCCGSLFLLAWLKRKAARFMGAQFCSAQRQGAAVGQETARSRSQDWGG